jgi:hypothetical protein
MARPPARLAARRLLPLLALLGGLPLAGCDSGDPQTNDFLIFGVNITRLFDVPPTAAEEAAVLAEWAARSPEPVDVQIVEEAAVDGARLVVLSHEMREPGGGAAFRHYGVVRIPDGAANAPVLVVNHGGDDGFDLASALAIMEGYPSVYDATVIVMPTYRSESVRTSGVAGLGETYASGGGPSPWDYDVDDTIALMEAALDLFAAETDAERIGTLGLSRGGDVSLLLAVRDERIDAVTEYFGPADFFDPTIRLLAIGALAGSPAALGLPGAEYLRANVLLPLQGPGGTYDAGADYARARLEILRRSPARFTERLPHLQVHHHRRDGVVPFAQSTALDAAVQAAGTGGEYAFYPYGDAPASDADLSGEYHDPFAMPESFARTVAFLEEHLLTPTFAGAWGD